MKNTRYFYDYKCSIFRTQTKKEKGTEIVEKIPVYENIDCSYWSKSNSMRNTALWVETILNSYELNLKPEYNNVKIWDEVAIDWIYENFVIENLNFHKNFRWKLDNIQIFLKISN